MRGMRTLYSKAPPQTRISTPKNGLPRTPERAISARQSPIIRPKKRRRISEKFSPAGAHKFKCPTERKTRAARTERKL
jgi:hypothetical protein